VLQHLIGKKVEFGLFHDPDRIVIAHFGGDEDHLPSLWSMAIGVSAVRMQGSSPTMMSHEASIGGGLSRLRSSGQR